ncbi:MAG: polysaccharide biosynthesis protein [Eubacteriales bacterium]
MGKTSKNKANQFIVQGSILAAVGIIVRVIGLVKRIPLTNIIGDRGNGFYSAAYEIYAIVLLISSYSLPLAVSKLVSARVAVGQYGNANKILKGALVFALISGGISSVLVFIFADVLAGPVMLEPLSAIALKVLAPTLLVVALMGVLRGYFQGMGTMIPTAISQVLEQVFVVIASVLGAMVLYDYGTLVGDLLDNEYYAAAYGAAGGSLGPLVGAVAGLLFLVGIYILYRNQIQKRIRNDRSTKKETYLEIVPILLTIIIPVIMSTAIYNISNILDQRIYNQVMIANGLEDIKTVHWGIYTGKYNVLTNIPIAFASALCASTVPAIAASISQGNKKALISQIRKVTKLTLIIAIPCAVAFTVIGPDILQLLFSDSSELAQSLLQVGSITIVFYSISTLSNGILQGIDKIHIPVRNALIALAIHLAALYVMLTTFNLGIHAVVYAKIIFSLAMCILNALALKKHLHAPIPLRKNILLSLIASLGMGLVLLILTNVFSVMLPSSKIFEVVGMAIMCVVGACVYFVILILIKGISKRELQSIPGGRFLTPIIKRMR